MILAEQANENNKDNDQRTLEIYADDIKRAKVGLVVFGILVAI